MEVTPYPHPNHSNVTLWDLPGIGTKKFPADKYLEDVGFERFDFFIIISADRFTEHDVKLAQEIQKMGKKFYFVRSKIDHDVYDEKRRLKSKFNEKRTLANIRENCIQGLRDDGFESPKVFLVSSCELHLYDFNLLEETMERDIPAHKRDALLLAMPNVNPVIITKKKAAFQAKIKYHAFTSALAASAPIPGLSFATDIASIVATIKIYQLGFGLDQKSLQNVALRADMSLDDLKSVMTSPLAAKNISTELIIKLLCFSVADVALMAAEEGSRLIPLFGIPAAMGLSFISTYKALNMFLNMMYEDAQKVSKKALGLNTSV